MVNESNGFESGQYGSIARCRAAKVVSDLRCGIGERILVKLSVLVGDVKGRYGGATWVADLLNIQE